MWSICSSTVRKDKICQVKCMLLKFHSSGTHTMMQVEVRPVMFPHLFYVSSWFLSKIVSQEDLKSPKKFEIHEYIKRMTKINIQINNINNNINHHYYYYYKNPWVCDRLQWKWCLVYMKCTIGMYTDARLRGVCLPVCVFPESTWVLEVCVLGVSVIWVDHVFQTSDEEKQLWQSAVSSPALGSKTKRRWLIGWWII